MATRDQYVAEAFTFYDAKWKHRARTRERVDCVGLVLVPAIIVGLASWEWDLPYTRQPQQLDFVSHFQAKATATRPKDTAKAGTVFIMREQLLPLHCGICVFRRGVPMVLHASVARRKVTLDYYSDLRAKVYPEAYDMNFEDL